MTTLANDDARWREIDEDWYRSGRRYREFPTLPGRASAVFRSWLNHPSYDRFWQKWLPFGDEFANIDIPVLTVTGYYSAGETAALYYFTQHHRHDANADHALLIGPFDEQSVEHGASSSVRELGSGRGGAHRPERRALRMVRACAQGGGAAGAA